MIWLTIENGEVFEGTLEQFQDCFFSNADIPRIMGWCFDHCYSFKIKRASADEVEEWIRSSKTPVIH